MIITVGNYPDKWIGTYAQKSTGLSAMSIYVCYTVIERGLRD